MTTLKFRTNLSCGSCVAAVKPHLDGDPGIREWTVDTAEPHKVLTVKGDNLTAEVIAHHVASAGFKVLGQIVETAPVIEGAVDEADQKGFVAKYWPLLLVLGYLLGVVAVIEVTAGRFDGMRAMANFMGGFFIAFSFFKLLDLQGFVDSFRSYDIAAREVSAYGYLYPFIELALGVAYLTGFAPLVTNIVTVVIMLIGIVGVTQALWQKRRIQCACLGTVFNLPMSKVTFIEDGLMAGMAAAMIVVLIYV